MSTNINRIHHATFAFIANGPPNSIFWPRVISQALAKCGYNWDGETKHPDKLGRIDYTRVPISDGDLATKVCEQYGLQFVRELFAKLGTKEWVIIDFHSDSVLTSGRLIVFYS